MAASITEQILEAARVALYNAIPAVGTRVFRARLEEISREECPAIVISGGDELGELASIAADATRVTLTVDIEIHVAGGDPWETAADLILVPMHALLMAVTWPGDATIDGRIGGAFPQAGDGTPAARLLTYSFSYFHQTAALDTPY